MRARIAVKLIKNVDEIPKKSLRSKKDLGYSLSTCQAFSYSRRRGITIAQMKEDMWCPKPVMDFGLEETPEYFLERASKQLSYG